MPMPKQKPGKSKQNYATPECFITAVLTRLDISHFGHDFAADRNNSKGHSYWDEAFNSLGASIYEWVVMCDDGWGWLNPPFAKIAPWALRCLEVSINGGHIAFLVPAAVGSNWYRDYINKQAGVKVLFLNGRIAFDPEHPEWGYPKDCMLVLFGTGEPFEIDVWTWR
jgi:hypothetical protein